MFGKHENRHCLADSKRPGEEESKKYKELDASWH
jgi:hypothetical protein